MAHVAKAALMSREPRDLLLDTAKITKNIESRGYEGKKCFCLLFLNSLWARYVLNGIALHERIS